ncbi:MAG: DoxX family protein [Bryobacterales bacterium]|nr:DoxX family protein [Bryobacterales bacterium]
MKTRLWAGRVLSALPVLVLLMSATMKFVRPAGFDDGLAHMGLPLAVVPALGVLEILCTVIYLVPRTAVLGAILLTGYLGGAISIHVRVGDPFVIQPLLGAMLWGGLYLRDARLQALIPLVRD